MRTEQREAFASLIYTINIIFISLIQNDRAEFVIYVFCLEKYIFPWGVDAFDMLEKGKKQKATTGLQ